MTTRSLTPHLPTFTEARHFIRILDGVAYRQYRDMVEAIWAQRGSPQENVEWSDPDRWIAERLEGTERELAERLWRESEGSLNPRHVRGCWYLSQNHDLLQVDTAGILRLATAGQEFLQEDETIIATIDNYEGILVLLQILKKEGAGKFSHLLPTYAQFCRQLTRYNSKSSITQSLRARLGNLLERGLIERTPQYVYTLAAAGQGHLQRHQALVPALTETETAEAPVESNDATDDEPEAESETVRSLTPGLPLYREARHFLRILDGVAYSLYRNTYNEIWEQRGSPQEQMDWAEPDQWIPKYLSGEEAELALRIWRESGRELNPRYLRGKWYLTTKHDLLLQERDGTLQITERGRRFIDDPVGRVVAEIDSYEGVLTILRLVAERGPGKRSDFLDEYAEFCRQYTGYRSETPIRGSLYDRLVNLIDRNYISRSGQVYEVTDAGLTYLERYASYVPGQPQRSQGVQSNLRRLIQEIKQEARAQLADYLQNMDPFKFEHLVKFLLEEIGYRNVEVTSPTNDKGVDVVAEIELGISSVREVVQVKRHRANVGRRMLDQLRGSLHRFNAMRGTIITTGGFSKTTKTAAFERGAAPITLIDGDKLLDLLIEHGIGVSKQKIDYLEFDAVKLAQFETSEAEEPEV